MSSFIGTRPHQVPTNGDLGRLAYLDYLGVNDIGTSIPTVASASSIFIYSQITYVSGVVTIANITPPVTFVNGGQITIIPTGKFSLSTAGNISIAVNAEISKPIYLTYDSVSGLWYPSYSSTVNRVTITAPLTGSTLTISDTKTLTANKTLTFDGVDNKTLTVNKSLTLDGADSKTLTLNASLTVNTTNSNAVTLDLRTGGTVVYTSDSVSKLTGGGLNQIAYQTAVDTTGFISAPTVANTVLTYNGSSLVWAGSGLTPTPIKTSASPAYTAAANDLVRCNTSTGAFTISLPASPLDGTILAFVDVGNSFATNNLTINPNSKTIEGSSSSMVSNVNGAYLEFTYVSTSNNWKMLQAPLTVSSIVATGTRDSTTYLAGDGTWKSIKETTYTPTITGSGSISVTVDFSTVNSTTVIINLPAGVTGATITFINLSTPATSGTIFSFSVIVSHVSALSADTAVVFRHGASLLPKWTGNIIPPSTVAAGSIDIWSFFTYDSGVSLVGNLAMADVRNTA